MGNVVANNADEEESFVESAIEGIEVAPNNQVLAETDTDGQNQTEESDRNSSGQDDHGDDSIEEDLPEGKLSSGDPQVSGENQEKIAAYKENNDKETSGSVSNLSVEEEINSDQQQDNGSSDEALCERHNSSGVEEDETNLPEQPEPINTEERTSSECSSEQEIGSSCEDECENDSKEDGQDYSTCEEESMSQARQNDPDQVDIEESSSDSSGGEPLFYGNTQCRNKQEGVSPSDEDQKQDNNSSEDFSGNRAAIVRDEDMIPSSEDEENDPGVSESVSELLHVADLSLEAEMQRNPSYIQEKIEKDSMSQNYISEEELESQTLNNQPDCKEIGTSGNSSDGSCDMRHVATSSCRTQNQDSSGLDAQEIPTTCPHTTVENKSEMAETGDEETNDPRVSVSEIGDSSGPCLEAELHSSRMQDCGTSNGYSLHSTPNSVEEELVSQIRTNQSNDLGTDDNISDRSIGEGSSYGETSRSQATDLSDQDAQNCSTSTSKADDVESESENEQTFEEPEEEGSHLLATISQFPCHIPDNTPEALFPSKTIEELQQVRFNGSIDSPEYEIEIPRLVLNLEVFIPEDTWAKIYKVFFWYASGQSNGFQRQLGYKTFENLYTHIYGKPLIRSGIKGEGAYPLHMTLFPLLRNHIEVSVGPYGFMWASLINSTREGSEHQQWPGHDIVKETQSLNKSRFKYPKEKEMQYFAELTNMEKRKRDSAPRLTHIFDENLEIPKLPHRMSHKELGLHLSNSVRRNVYSIVFNLFPFGVEANQLEIAFRGVFHRDLLLCLHIDENKFAKEYNSDLHSVLKKAFSDLLSFEKLSPIHSLIRPRLDIPVKIPEVMLKDSRLIEYQTAIQDHKKREAFAEQWKERMEARKEWIKYTHWK